MSMNKQPACDTFNSLYPTVPAKFCLHFLAIIICLWLDICFLQIFKRQEERKETKQTWTFSLISKERPINNLKTIYLQKLNNKKTIAFLRSLFIMLTNTSASFCYTTPLAIPEVLFFLLATPFSYFKD
ncbi:hypothetical protein Y1Q_0022081 [Alligator mississippiensis]|uniref:Uncharacterized protein n=1 Tax=Alligator mississippiensis TaxID=8496 RepID=A0A151NTP2_ALLMI|nr:hypothetical protein Y1Q_0022081 [Alligator mississippiensis]